MTKGREVRVGQVVVTAKLIHKPNPQKGSGEFIPAMMEVVSTPFPAIASSAAGPTKTALHR
jgi:hypothetical protein